MRIIVAEMGRIMKIMRILSIAIITLFIAAPATNANSLIATNPLSGATITVAPSAVSVTGQVVLIDAGNSMEVTDPQGKRVDDGVLAIDGASAVIGLKTLKVAGVYTVTYSLFAENDIPLEGSFRFTFAAPNVISTPEPTPIESTSPKAEVSNWGTNAFVIGMLVVALFVLVLLSLYARKIFKER
jgi:methionine-rich copper-binding protein CopC